MSTQIINSRPTTTTFISQHPNSPSFSPLPSFEQIHSLSTDLYLSSFLTKIRCLVGQSYFINQKTLAKAVVSFFLSHFSVRVETLEVSWKVKEGEKGLGRSKVVLSIAGVAIFKLYSRTIIHI